MEQSEIILGVDTHLEVHVGAVISETGKLLGTLSVSASTAGYLSLLTWATSFGHLRRAGVEGTGSYGAGVHDLTVVLPANGYTDLLSCGRVSAMRYQRPSFQSSCLHPNQCSSRCVMSHWGCRRIT